MKKFFSLFILLFVTIVSSYANGGPVDWSTIVKSGDMRFLNKSHIELINEKLNISVVDDYCLVNVNYTLKNNSKYTADTIVYGFPVDFARDEGSGSFKWRNDYIKNLRFKIGEKKLPIKKQVDFNVLTDTIRDLMGQKIVKKRKWYFTEFIVDKEETINLNVSYLIKSNYSDWKTTKEFFASYSKRIFRWDFSPAQYWGDGEVKKMSIEISIDEKIKENEDFNISGLSFIEKGNTYLFESNNFDLKNANPITIKYNNSFEKRASFIKNHQIPDNYIKNIKTSSTLENYPIDNINDNDFKTAWVEGKEGPGKGEWIEFNLKGFNLGAILIVNGYTKSKDTYYTNNRLKSVQIEYDITGKKNPKYNKTYSLNNKLEDRSFVNVNFENLYSFAYVMELGAGYDKINRVRIKILDTYKGTKYNDTCISEIFLLGFTPND